MDADRARPLRDNGGVAQLGARLNGIEKVWGSNPHTSIRFVSPLPSRLCKVSRTCDYTTTVRQGPARPAIADEQSHDVSISVPSEPTSASPAYVRRLRGRFRLATSRFAWAVMASILLIDGFCCTSSGAQTPTKSSHVPTELIAGVPDVSILVIPTSYNGARVSLAYRRREPHGRVRQEIGKLAANGWVLGRPVSVQDGTVRADDPGRAPVVTSAQFTLSNAPQVVDNAPAVVPYLQAFQRNYHVSVVFNLSDLAPYNGIESFDSPALIVQRRPADNAYQYEALIKDHEGTLPQLTVGKRADRHTDTAHGEGTPNGRLPGAGRHEQLPWMLVLLIVGLLGGIAVYGWLVKLASRTRSSRISRE